MGIQAQIETLLGKLNITEKLIPAAFNIIIILVLTLVAMRAARLITARKFRIFKMRKEDIEFQKRAETLGAVIRYILNLTIVSVAIVMILGESGINIAPVLATAGIVGLAVGFGAQTLVQDVIAGFFILLDDQIRVGDVVEIAGKSGLVEKVDLRMTTLRDVSGNVHYVRHGKIDVVTNMTKDFSHFVFDIPVRYCENVDEIIEIVKNVDGDLRKDPAFRDDIIAPIEVMGLDRFEESAVIIRARTTTRPMKQWGVAREFNRRLKMAFDTNNVELPFRQLTLHIGQDKQGRPVPLHVVTHTNSAPGASDSRQGA